MKHLLFQTSTQSNLSLIIYNLVSICFLNEKVYIPISLGSITNSPISNLDDEQKKKSGASNGIVGLIKKIPKTSRQELFRKMLDVENSNLKKVKLIQ